jgi:uncharacterized C2H2 Zn-finger protein
MPYTKKDLKDNQFPLKWEPPTTAWLDQSWSNWREGKTKNPVRWLEEVKLYDYMQVNIESPQGLRCCDYCQLGFTSATWMLMHFNTYDHKVARAKAKGLPIPPDPLYCSVCEFRAMSHRRMESHLKTSWHLSLLAKKEGRPVPTDERYCVVCDRGFCSITACRNHMVTDTHLKVVAKKSAETFFRCEVCQNGFSTKQSLERHNNSQHKTVVVKTQPQTSCSVCQKSYANRRQYLKHCRTPKHKAKIMVI